MHLKLVRDGVAVYGGRKGDADPLLGGKPTRPERSLEGRQARLRGALRLTLRQAARFTLWEYEDGRIGIVGPSRWAPRVAVETHPPARFEYTDEMKARALERIRQRRETEDPELMETQYFRLLFRTFMSRVDREFGRDRPVHTDARPTL